MPEPRPDGCQHSFTWTSAFSGSNQQPAEHTLSTCGACGTIAQWRAGAWHPDGETLGSRAMGMSDRYGKALQQIIAVLGPEAGCGEKNCDGCEWEMGEALRLAKEAFGVA